jgi:hypothetical protein
LKKAGLKSPAFSFVTGGWLFYETERLYEIALNGWAMSMKALGEIKEEAKILRAAHEKEDRV